MRLLMITKDFPPDVGGIQTYCLELGRIFAGRLDAFGVVAPRIAGDREVDASLPFPVYRVPSTRSTFAGLVSGHLPRIRRRLRFDAVLAAQWQTAMPALLARPRLGHVPVFAAVHGREILTRHLSKWPAGPRAYAAARHRVIERLDGLFPVSRYALELVEEAGIPYRRALVIPNGCNPEEFHPVDGAPVRRQHGLGERPVMLTLCRLVERKGIDTVIEALPKIAQSVPEVVYLVAGSGEDRPRLEALAARLGVADRVRFLGRVSDDDRLALYSSCDLFVMPAREERPCVEGFGLVFLEANACGAAVVGSRSGGIPDAIIEGETGAMVPPGDSAAFAAVAAPLLADREGTRAMGQRARRFVQERGTWQHVADRMLAEIDTWTEAIASRRAL